MDKYSHEFSVLVITYNHALFIEQAIQSILSQDFKGRLQIVIGVDKSEDNTLETCKVYQQKYPDIIELIEHNENVGMYQNFYNTLRRCTGKYISILEGDDYWVYDYKIQKQFDFFENHLNCILSAGGNIEVDENGKVLSKKTFKIGSKDEVLLREDLIIINRITTLTTAFRKSAIKWPEIDKLQNSPHLDWSFYISLNYPPDGFIYKFKEVFGAYRIHGGGVYSSISSEKRNQNVLKSIYFIYNLELDEVYKEYIKSLFANFSLKISNKEMLFNDPYKSLFDPLKIIYNKNNTIKRDFIFKIYKSIFFKNKSKENFKFWKMNFELLRQTRPSLKTYFNLLLLPLFPIIFILQLKDKLEKKRFMQQH